MMRYPIKISRWVSMLPVLLVGILAACAAEDSAPVGLDDSQSVGNSLVQQIEGTYTGTWTIELRPNIGVAGECPGHVLIRAESIKEQLEGSLFTGAYFIDALDDCVDGSTVTGEVLNGTMREDGGVNFGLDIPGSDGNFFDDVLAGSGVNFPVLEAFSCSIEVIDINNHMDGSIVDGRLRAANSARLNCEDTSETLENLTVRVSIDASR